MEEKRIKRYKEKLEYLDEIANNVEDWMKNLDEINFVENLGLQKKFGIYHAFQISIEVITDIIAMIVKDLKIIPKDDYTNIEVLKKKILSLQI